MSKARSSHHEKTRTAYDLYVGWEDGLGADFGWRYDDLKTALRVLDDYEHGFLNEVKFYSYEVESRLVTKGMEKI